MLSTKSIYDYYWRPKEGGKASKVKLIKYRKGDDWITCTFLESALPYFKKGQTITLSKWNFFAVKRKA